MSGDPPYPRREAPPLVSEERVLVAARETAEAHRVFVAADVQDALRRDGMVYIAQATTQRIAAVLRRSPEFTTTPIFGARGRRYGAWRAVRR